MKSQIDNGVWKRFQNGDVAAFEKIYELHYDLLFGYGMKIAKDPDRVVECIQALFINLWQKKESISCPDNVTGYLVVSLRNRILLEKKSRSKNGIANAAGLDEIAETYDFKLDIDIEQTLVNAEIEKEHLDALQKALDELPPRQREVIYLRYYKSLPIRDVAEVMGISEQVVRNVTSKAVGKMRDRMVLKLFLSVVF